MVKARVQRRLAAILATDTVGYSRMMGADETGTLARMQALCKELLEPKVAEYGGRIVKTTGDGALIEFPSAVDAVQHALDVQTAIGPWNADTPEDQRIELRMGINVGDIIVEADDIYGDGVNVAARLEALAAPGSVCISGTVFDQVKGKLDQSFDDLGPKEVKNIAEPVRVYQWQAEVADPATATEANQSPRSSDKPSIAVLAFDNLSGDPDQEYFSDGITEDIITELSKISGLFVIARHSSFLYKNKKVSRKQVGRELGVRYALEGSVRKAGNRLRITAQLIDATSDHHVWAERYDRDLEDIFAVQDEVAQEIVSVLAVKLTSDEALRLSRKETCDVEAYELFLRGRELVSLHTKIGAAEGRALLQRAIALDGSFAAAYALEGIAHVTEYINGWSEDAQVSLRKAEVLSQKAAELDDTEP